MLLGTGGIAESSVREGIRRKGRAIGLVEAFAEGYVGLYADVFAEGYAEGCINNARTTLLRLGAKKLGPPDGRIEAEITALGDLDRLHDLIDRVLDVSTWDDLLAPPGPPA